MPGRGSLSIAHEHASLPVAYRLYLPREWTEDRDRLRKAGVPADIGFKTKHEIALEQLRWACAAGLPPGVVLLDAGYGNNSSLRADITTLGLRYVAGILSNTTVWAEGAGPLPPKRWSGRGRPPKRLRRDAAHWPVSVKDLALSLPKSTWRTIEWREGSAEILSSRFARVRVRAARRDERHHETRPEEWLLIEWPKGEKEPTKYFLSTLPEDITFRRLVYFAKLRWRIERDYLELKQERRRFPPQQHLPPRSSRNLPFPQVTDQEELPLRPERHIPNSIATMRIRLANAIARTLPRCPCCGHNAIRQQQPRFMTQ